MQDYLHVKISDFLAKPPLTKARMINDSQDQDQQWEDTNVSTQPVRPFHRITFTA